jgi:hypothetical protein
MLQLEKLITNLFLSLQVHNIYCQQWKLSKFLMRYKKFAFLAYCGAVRPVSKMASQQENGSYVLEVSRPVITVQREFHERFKNEIILVSCVFFKSSSKLTLHCNHRSKRLKTEPTKSLLFL